MNVNTSKICKTCKEEKDISNFHYQKRECKSCNNKKRRVNKELIGTKICVRCGEERDIKRFRPTRNVCHDCIYDERKKYMKDYYEKNKKEWKEKEHLRNRKKMEELDESKQKECIDCKENKSIIDFRLNRNRCKDCERKFNREWVLDKRHNDPIFKFISNYRTRLIQALKKDNKVQHTNDYLGDNIVIIKSWLDFCFDDTMSWDNQGSCWHVDHVIPVSRFELYTENDVIKCFNWKNLSPLTAKENLTKSNNVIPSQVKEHIDKLRLFVSTYYIDKYNEVEEYISDVFLPFLTKI